MLYNINMDCNDCPRMCNVDREKTTGFCHERSSIRISKIIENFMWEEPPVSGKKGALAIFFSGCNMRCQFCQNFEISHVGKGERYTPAEFAKVLSKYDLSRFESIDLVSPTQFSSLLVEAFSIFKPTIPVVWNSNGFENIETIERVSKFVDIFLVDFKYYDDALSTRLSATPDYFKVASKAVVKMSQLKKTIIRHLILPGHVDDSIKILDFIKENVIEPRLSLMSQFTPFGKCELKRKIYPLEFKIVYNHAIKLGLTNGFYQGLESADEKFIPSF